LCAITKNIQFVVDQDGGAILDIEAGRITTLNPTGAFVWQGLKRGDSIRDIVARLSRETGEDVGTVDAHVQEFIDSLMQRNLYTR
jgi:hypothetical protein